jgi:hypothetical protein
VADVAERLPDALQPPARLAFNYRWSWLPGDEGLQPAAGVSAMPQHGASPAKSYDEQAQMYTAMAVGERELAKAAK